MKKHLWLLGVFFFPFGICVFAQSNTATSTIPSISWAHGDTIETLRKRNPNASFDKTEEDSLYTQYRVVEGRQPTITETTFAFGKFNNNRLTVITWRKVGAALDIYEPLFNKYKTIYGNPTANNEFGINQHQTNLNGFYVFTGNSSFDNSTGNVTLLIVASDSRNLPYVFLTESYKY